MINSKYIDTAPVIQDIYNYLRGNMVFFIKKFKKIKKRGEHTYILVADVINGYGIDEKGAGKSMML